MAHDLAVGICRFSFLGRGDWAQFRDVPHGQEADILARVADALYTPERLAYRMWCLENVLLPSIAAQTDPDFRFILLTSPELPAPLLDTMRDLIGTVPQARILVSHKRSVDAALVPELLRLSEAEGRRLVQFRIDDDDGLSADYVARLNAAARAMTGEGAYGFTMPRQMIVTRYADAPLRFYEMSMPFHSAGCAVRPFHRDRTVFSFGHFAIGGRFVHVQDPRAIGSIQLKFQGHDSRPFDPRRIGRDRVKEIGADGAKRMIAKAFPFLKDIDFEEGAGLSLVQP